MSETESSRPRSDAFHAIEGRHFGRCLAQVWAKDRKTLIEILEHPKARASVVVVKTFEKRVAPGSREWPDLLGVKVYAEIEPNTGDWANLEAGIAKLEA